MLWLILHGAVFRGWQTETSNNFYPNTSSPTHWRSCVIGRELKKARYCKLNETIGSAKKSLVRHYFPLFPHSDEEPFTGLDLNAKREFIEVTTEITDIEDVFGEDIDKQVNRNSNSAEFWIITIRVCG